MHTSPTPSADSPLPVMSSLMASLPAYPTASSSSPAAFPIYHTQTAAAASSAAASSYSSPPAATHSASAPQGRRPSPPLHPHAAYAPTGSSATSSSSSSSSSAPAAEMYNPRYITHRLLDIERCLHHLTSVAYVHPITGQGLVSAFYAIKYAMQALGAEEKQLEARLRRRREAVKLEGVDETAEEGEGLLSVLSRELSGPEDESHRQREMRDIRRKKRDLRHVGEFIHQQIAALYAQVQTQMKYHPVQQQQAAQQTSAAFTFSSSASSAPAASAASSFFSSSFASGASAYTVPSTASTQSFPPPPLPELTGSLSSSSASSSSSPTCITPPPAAPPLPTFIGSPRPSSPPAASFLAFPPVDKLGGEYTPLFDFSDPFSVSSFAPSSASASSSSSSPAYFHRPLTQVYSSSSSSDSRDAALASGWAAEREEGRAEAGRTGGKRRTRGLSHGEGLSSLSAAYDAGGYGGSDRMTEEDNDEEEEEREQEGGVDEHEGGRAAQRRGRRGGGRRRKREDYAEVLYAYPRQHSAFPKLPSEAENPHELPEDRAANAHRPRMHRQMTE